MRAPVPPVVDLVLIGGGHSHVQVLRSLGMRPAEATRVIVISREVFTPYSGMLPGHVANRYGEREMHIDLGPLARFAGARLVADEVVALDADAGRIELADRPPIAFDLLSVNCGAVPAVDRRHGVSVKPIGRFLPHWRHLQAVVRPEEQITLVGGGAGGVELALAMRRALHPRVRLCVVSDLLLSGWPAGAVAAVRAALVSAGVEVLDGFRLAATDELPTAADASTQVRLTAEDGRTMTTDHLFWVTGVEAPPWLRPSGLALDSGGFVRVDAHLRSVSHPKVFAAGDVAALDGQRRPKSGVFAVRQGPLLAENLRRAVSGRRLRRYRAQRRALAILGTGDGRAVARRGELWVQGRWVWWWKDVIDRRFMARFRDLPAMDDDTAAVALASEDWRRRLPDAMRCGGCGAKLGADPLRRVLARLPDQQRLERERGVALGIGDDAAVVHTEAADLIMTIDGFRSLLDDPYLFGRITAHHALNDLLAMGASGIAALAMASVPVMAEAMMEDDLYLLLKGAVEVLNEHAVPLVGGHSAEAHELSLALALTGVRGARLLTKRGLAEGDALVLTKPLGTGALLAAHMRGRLGSDHLAAALASMDRSNAAALAVLTGHDVTALTDVSGFGLLGHLGEMLRACGLGATVTAATVPLLPGARQAVEAGIVSSLQANNEAVLGDFAIDEPAADPRLRLLVDPQTSGGLLAGIPWRRAADCVTALAAAGYGAAVIGRVTAGAARIDLAAAQPMASAGSAP